MYYYTIMPNYRETSILAEDDKTKHWQEADGCDDDEPHDSCEPRGIHISIEL